MSVYSAQAKEASIYERGTTPERSNSLSRSMRRIANWLSSREYRPLWHLAAVIIITGFASLLFYQHFHNHGILMHADMTFPLTLDRITGEVTNTWLEYGGFQVVQFIQNSPWILSFMVVAKIFQLSTAQYLMVMFITTFALAGVSMYALSYSTIRSIKPLDSARYGLFAGAILAAVVYMYNPFSLFTLWPFMMYTAYALMPLIFMLLVKTYNSPKPRYIAGLALLISVCSTHPMCMAWVWIMVLAYSIYYLIVNKFGRRNLITAAKVFFSSILLYLFINAAWVVPYLNAKLLGKPMVPAYGPYLTQSSLDGLSQTCTLSNNLRLISGFGQFGIMGSNTALNVLLSFALPVFVVFCLVLLRKQMRTNPTVVFFAVFSVISILVATGSSFVLRRPYSYLVLRAPGSASLGWIFRAPNRLLFVVPVFYGLAIGILVAWLLQGIPRIGRDSTGLRGVNRSIG